MSVSSNALVADFNLIGLWLWHLFLHWKGEYEYLGFCVIISANYWASP